jgi:hypothetical protein
VNVGIWDKMGTVLTVSNPGTYCRRVVRLWIVSSDWLTYSDLEAVPWDQLQIVCSDLTKTYQIAFRKCAGYCKPDTLRRTKLSVGDEVTVIRVPNSNNWRGKLIFRVRKHTGPMRCTHWQQSGHSPVNFSGHHQHKQT